MPPSNPALLDFQSVTILRDGRPALDKASLRIGLGENVAIIGPNGSGKSTLIKAVTRECYPSDGRLRIFGEDDWDVFELRSLLGIVSSDLEKFCAEDVSGRGVPGLEAVISGYFSSVGVWREVTPAMEKKARNALGFLGVGHLADRPMTDMSAGEARRVLIARALVHDPKALLLDEPTNSLDVSALQTFLQTLRKIARSGKSIILVTHNLHDVIPEIKRVVLLSKGKVFMDGPKEKVLTSGNLSQLFGAKVAVLRQGDQFVLR